MQHLLPLGWKRIHADITLTYTYSEECHHKHQFNQFCPGFASRSSDIQLHICKHATSPLLSVVRSHSSIASKPSKNTLFHQTLFTNLATRQPHNAASWTPSHRWWEVILLPRGLESSNPWKLGADAAGDPGRLYSGMAITYMRGLSRHFGYFDCLSMWFLQVGWFILIRIHWSVAVILIEQVQLQV